MKRPCLRQLGLVLCSLIALCAVLLAQEKAQDRRRWLDPNATVTDDPRRIPIAPGLRGPEGTIVLRGGRIFDGTGAAVRNATVVIKRNKIEKLLPPAATDWPPDARVIDVGGKTILPGLIDLHVHLTLMSEATPDPDAARSAADAALRAAERLRFCLESGITSVRDVGSHWDAPFRVKEWVTTGRLIGARVFPAGQLITGKGGHGAEGHSEASPRVGAKRIASGPDDWREAVREQFDRGADVIKIASHFSRDEVKAAVEEAHALGLRVTCDCETFYVQWAVEAGVDCIEHPLPRTEEIIQLMAQRGTASVPTLFPFVFIFERKGGFFGSTSRRFSFTLEDNLELVRKMRRAGIKIGVGTDMLDNLFAQLPDPYLTELKLFVKAGYTIPETLVAATKTGAEILDMSDKLGTLEPGKLADVVVIDGKPDLNLDDLAKIDLVIRDGVVAVERGRIVVPRHAPNRSPKPTGN